MELKLDVEGGSFVVLKTLDGGDGIAGDGGAWINPLFSQSVLSSIVNQQIDSNVEISKVGENLIFTSGKDKIISIAMYDLQGKLIENVMDINKKSYTKGKNVKSDMYLFRITTEDGIYNKVIFF